MIPLLNPTLRAAEKDGTLSREFHRWLQLVEQALRGPFIGMRARGAFAVLDGQYAICADNLILAGSEEATLHGDSVLVVI